MGKLVSWVELAYEKAEIIAVETGGVVVEILDLERGVAESGERGGVQELGVCGVINADYEGLVSG